MSTHETQNAAKKPQLYMTWLDKILTKCIFVLDYRVIERPVSSIGETELEKRSLHKMIFLPLKLRKTVRLPGH